MYKNLSVYSSVGSWRLPFTFEITVNFTSISMHVFETKIITQTFRYTICLHRHGAQSMNQQRLFFKSKISSKPCVLEYRFLFFYWNLSVLQYFSRGMSRLLSPKFYLYFKRAKVEEYKYWGIRNKFFSPESTLVITETIASICDMRSCFHSWLTLFVHNMWDCLLTTNTASCN
jgi:hypothetical protein